MQGNYISIADFEQYKKNEAASALAVLDMNLRNPNLLNQAAARMLGFSSYEALQPMHQYERLIRDAVLFEPQCPYQGNRAVFRHKNILVVCDFQLNRVIAKALNPGEERGYLHFQNVSTDSGLSLPFPAPVEVNGAPRTNVGFSHGSIKLGAVASYDTNRPKQPLVISVDMEGSGVRISIKQSGEKTASAYLRCNSGVPDRAVCEVNQAALHFEQGDPSADRVIYRWKLKTLDDSGTPRLLNLGQNWKDGEIPPTDLFFHSIAEAQAFRKDNNFDFEEEDFEGLVLVRQTNTEV